MNARGMLAGMATALMTTTTARAAGPSKPILETERFSWMVTIFTNGRMVPFTATREGRDLPRLAPGILCVQTSPSAGTSDGTLTEALGVACAVESDGATTMANVGLVCHSTFKDEHRTTMILTPPQKGALAIYIGVSCWVNKP